MTDQYIFKDPYFGVSEDGIHLLRNGYNYKTIGFHEIRLIEFKRGRSIKNWWGLLLFGLFLFSIGIYSAYALVHFFSDDEGGHIYIEEILIPFFPILIGGLALYKALIQERIIVIWLLSDKNLVFSIKALEKGGKFPEMLQFLSTKTTIAD